MKRNKTEIRSLRNAAEEALAKGVTTKAALLEALPVLVEIQDAITAARRNLGACTDAARELSEACAAYVEAHPSVLEAGRLVANQNGVSCGEIVIGDRVYRLACGFDGYMRNTGDACTQAFLETLPKAWTKPRLVLDTTGINDARPTDADLARAGLRQKPKNVWSLRED